MKLPDRLRPKRTLQAAYRAFIKPILRPIFRDFLLSEPVVFGDRSRVTVAPTANICNALLNTNSGTITIGEYVFFGTGVSLLAGTHNYETFFGERMTSPDEGLDIIVREGAWIATGATIIGPRIVGEHSVVAAGAVVVTDVPAYSIVAGVPARVIGSVQGRPQKNDAA